MNNLESDKYYALVRRHAALLSAVESIRDLVKMGASPSLVEDELTRTLRHYGEKVE